MPDHLQESWTVGGVEVPVRIYFEWRNTRRISIGKRQINIRLPLTDRWPEPANFRSWGYKWLSKQFYKHPELHERFRGHSFKNGQSLVTTLSTYQLHINTVPGTVGVKGLQIDKDIFVRHSPRPNNAVLKNDLENTLYKLIAKDQYQWIHQRIHSLNKKYFQKTIHQIRIRNNSSNWGSCSCKGNINIAFRTLLVPQQVMDYVFVHELTHLIEMNHTPKFWRIVEGVLPDYRQSHGWLKNEGKYCHL